MTNEKTRDPRMGILCTFAEDIMGSIGEELCDTWGSSSWGPQETIITIHWVFEALLLECLRRRWGFSDMEKVCKRALDALDAMEVTKTDEAEVQSSNDP